MYLYFPISCIFPYFESDVLKVWMSKSPFQPPIILKLTKHICMHWPYSSRLIVEESLESVPYFHVILWWKPSVFMVCLLDAFTSDLHLLLLSERQIKLIIWWVCRMGRMFRFLQKSNYLCHMRAQNDEEMFPHVLWFCSFSLGSFSDVDVNYSEFF